MALLAHQEARADTSGSSRSLAVHRLRFVDWSPSAVTALAISPSNAPSSRGILAIGRQNGNIDLCTWLGPRPALQSEFSDRSFQSDAAGWAVHTILPGHAHSKIEQLCFANPSDSLHGKARKLRLFSISGGSIVTEHFLPLQLARLGAQTFSSNGEDENMVKVGDLSSLFGKKALDTLDPHFPGESRTLPSLGGAIWSMAASATGCYLAIGCEDGQVRILDLQDSKFEHLASSAGKERLIVPRFDKTKGRIISLCWGPPIRRSKKLSAVRGENLETSSVESDEDDDDDDRDVSQWYESFLVGGLGVSAAVVWEASSGRIASKLALQKNRSESTIVWSVATLPDGTIVTGDSTGRVTFFDPQTRTPISGATFRAHATASDVLALTVGPDGRTVYSAGVDQKVAEFTKLDTTNQRGQWIQLASRRLHAHDIRAIALDPPYSPLASVQAIADGRSTPAVDRLPILVSGGVDFNLILTPAASPASITMALPASTLSKLPKSHSKHKRELLTADEQKHAAINPISSNPLTTFADTTQRRVPFVPTTARAGLMGGGSVAALCPTKGWVVLRREQSIGIWDLGSKEALVEAASAPDEQSATSAWYKLLEMQVKVDSNLISVAISDDGRYLAFSDLYECRLFELKQRKLASGLSEVEPKKVKSFGKAFGGQERIAPSASALRFSPDSTRLILCSLTGAYVHVLELPSDKGNDSVCRLLRSFGHHRRQRASEDESRQLAGRGHANGNGEHGKSTHTKQDRTERTISTVLQHAEISSDGAWLSTISSDLQHHVFSLDSLTFERTLPSPHALPSGVVFHPATSSHCSSLLTLVFSDNKVEFWDVESGKEMSKSDTAGVAPDTAATASRKTGMNGADTAHTMLVENLTRLKHTLQTKLASVRDFAISAMWIPSESRGLEHISSYTMLVYGATWICTARVVGRNSLDEDVQITDVTKKRKEAADWSVHTTFKYQPLLLVAHLPTPLSSTSTAVQPQQQQQQHLVIVERPYFELAANLPPAFYRGARYGT